MEFPLCDLCLRAMDCPTLSGPWDAPCVHQFHVFCLDRLAEVQRCAILKLQCPLCSATSRPVIDIEPTFDNLAAESGEAARSDDLAT